MQPLEPRVRRTLLGLAAASTHQRAARIALQEPGGEPDDARTVDVLGFDLEGPRWTVAAWFRDEALLRVLDLAAIRWARETSLAAGAGPAGFDRDRFRLGRYLGHRKVLSATDADGFRAEAREQVRRAVEEAEAFAAKPPLETLFEGVYAEPLWQQREQLAEIRAAIADDPRAASAR